MINSVSAKVVSPKGRVSFGAMIPVSYAVVDGQLCNDEKVLDDVTKQLVKQVKSPNSADNSIKQALVTATGDKSLHNTAYYVKKMGKYLITGSDAANLNNIWSLSDVAYGSKKEKASVFIKKLMANRSGNKLAVFADTSVVKGKVKYIVKSLFSTIY